MAAKMLAVLIYENVDKEKLGKCYDYIGRWLLAVDQGISKNLSLAS